MAHVAAANRLLIVKGFHAISRHREYTGKWYSDEAIIEVLESRFNLDVVFNGDTSQKLQKFNYAINKELELAVISLWSLNERGIYRVHFSVKTENGKRKERYFFYFCKDKSVLPPLLQLNTAQEAYNDNRIRTSLRGKRRRCDDAVFDNVVIDVPNDLPSISMPEVDYWSSLNATKLFGSNPDESVRDCLERRVKFMTETINKAATGTKIVLSEVDLFLSWTRRRQPFIDIFWKFGFGSFSLRHHSSSITFGVLPVQFLGMDSSGISTKSFIMAVIMLLFLFALNRFSCCILFKHGEYITIRTLFFFASF
jgi:hypothetical protein